MTHAYSDVLLVGGRPNQWVKYVNNDGNAAHVYVSTAVTTFQSATTGAGVYTFNPSPIGGIYTSYLIDGSLSATAPAAGDVRWAPSGITSHVVSYTVGDDAALNSTTVSGSPNTQQANGVATAGAGAASSGSLLYYLGLVSFGASNGVDDTADLNGHLAAMAGLTVRLTPNQNYKISASLVIASGTTLDLNGATITELAGSNCNLIHNNAWVVGSGRDSNITIKGGTFARGTNGGVGQQLHCLVMQRVDGLTIQDVTVTSGAGKFAINVYACTNFTVERITFNTFSDGVHISGASSNGRVQHIWGTTGDDSVACTPTDWPSVQNGDFGDIYNLQIANVSTTILNGAVGVKLLGGTHAGSTYNIRRVLVDNITVNSSAAAVRIGGDATFADTLNGNVTDITVRNVLNTGSARAVIINDAGPSAILTGITLEHIAQTDVANFVAIVLDASNAATTIGHLVIRDCYLASTVASNPIRVNNGAVVANLDVENCYFNLPGGIYAIQLAFTGSTITTAKFTSCRLNVATLSAGLIQTSGGVSQVVGTVFIVDLTVDQAIHCIGDWATGITTTLIIDGLRVTTVNDLIFNRAGSTINYLVGNGIVGTNGGKFGSTGTVNLNTTGKATPAYSASITPVATDAPWQTITATNGTAFTINAPTNPPDATHSTELTIEVLNSSGGALGVITWNAAFVFNGFVWANPANTKRRFVTFKWNGVNWIAVAMSTADY